MLFLVSASFNLWGAIRSEMSYKQTQIPALECALVFKWNNKISHCQQLARTFISLGFEWGIPRYLQGRRDHLHLDVTRYCNFINMINTGGIWDERKTNENYDYVILRCWHILFQQFHKVKKKLKTTDPIYLLSNTCRVHTTNSVCIHTTVYKISGVFFQTLLHW